MNPEDPNSMPVSQPMDGSTQGSAPMVEEVGSVVGGYRLLEQIGEGGFGVVWAAEQRVPVKRRVALKIIKLGMDTKQVVARFEAERQALALMDHPNIAKVLDAGATDTARPYFVMELVKGIPITQYCNQERVGIHDRLVLFVNVCRAIQHAHQKGIIHRDIKPSNIMVTLHDGVPVPKVIDFGIAKATQQELTEKTIYTQSNQFIGTPAYMSPEQAELSGLDIDTRSDIYSLGVMLYELLTGSTPFDAKELMKSGIDEMRKIIREREPDRPSMRMSQIVAGPVSRTGKSTLRPAMSIASDLDWIVMKCLEKDRSRRYDTAAGLAMDLRRHLENEPVIARPPSAIYRIQKTWRRHKGALTTIVAFILMVLVGAVLSGTLAVREFRAREAVERSRLQERQLNFRMSFDRGMRLCEQGHVGSGMLWLVHALELAPDEEKGMERVIRANLNAWSVELHSLEAVYPHDHAVMTVAFHPDGDRVVCGTHAGEIQMWNRESGDPMGRPLKHQNVAHELVFSEDGAHLFSSSYDGTVKHWDPESLQLKRTFQHDGEVYGLAALPGGRFASSTRQGSIYVWDPAVTEPVTIFPIASHSVHDLVVSHDGNQLLASCHNGEVLLWDFSSEQVLAKFVHLTRVPTATFAAADGSRIATGDNDGVVSLWEWGEDTSPAVGYRVRQQWRHKGGVHRLRLSPDGSRLVTASYDNNAQILSAESGRAIGFPFEHRGAIQSVAMSANGRVLTACDDNIAREWLPAAGALRRVMKHENPGLNEVSYSVDGRYALSWLDKKMAILHRTVTGERVGRPLPLGGGTYYFAISPDESRLMVGVGGAVQIWNPQTAEVVGESFPQSGQVSTAVSRSGDRMMSGGFGGVIELWNPETGRPLGPVLTLPGNPVRGVAFHPTDQNLMAAVYTDKTARLIAVETGEVIQTYRGHISHAMDVSFSADGRLLMTGGFDNTVRIWDVESGELVSGPLWHDGPLWYYSNFHPEERLVVTGCDDGTARVWDVETGEPIGPKLIHQAALRAAAFTDRRHEIVTGTANGSTRFWNVPTSPLEGAVERIKLWIQVSSGMELDPEAREIQIIDADEWKRRRQALRRLGGNLGAN